MFDGPMSPRYQTLMRAGSNLHEHGHEYFVSNDVEQPTLLDASSVDGYTVLSDREAQEAVRMMKHAVDHHPGLGHMPSICNILNVPYFPFQDSRGMFSYGLMLLTRPGLNSGQDDYYLTDFSQMSNL